MAYSNKDNQGQFGQNYPFNPMQNKQGNTPAQQNSPYQGLPFQNNGQGTPYSPYGNNSPQQNARYEIKWKRLLFMGGIVAVLYFMLKGCSAQSQVTPGNSFLDLNSLSSEDKVLVALGAWGMLIIGILALVKLLRNKI